MFTGYSYFFAITQGGDTSGLPIDIPCYPVCNNADAIRAEIAARLGVSHESVVLKGGMFGVGRLPMVPRRSATVVESRGSMYRIDVLEDNSLRARVCLGEIGQVPQLVADVTLPSVGGLVLVATTIHGEAAIVAHRLERTTHEEFANDWLTVQQAFRDDVSAHVQPGFGYAVTFGSMNNICQ